MVRDASHRSTALWALSQNSAVLPNNREIRIAISGLTERRSRSNSLTVWRDTPNAFANADIVTTPPGRDHFYPKDCIGKGGTEGKGSGATT